MTHQHSVLQRDVTETKLTYPLDVWYVIGLPTELGPKPLRRVVLDIPVVLYRASDAKAVALLDRCPHRFAPLSRGRCVSDDIECGYHGLVFDRTGACVRNPHGSIAGPRLRVRAFPIEERYGLVWVWPGDAGRADTARIPDLSYMIQPGHRTVHSQLQVNYRPDVLVDNLMDLSHSDYLHVGSFSGGPPERSEMNVVEQGDDVIMVRTQYGAPAPPVFAHLGAAVDLSFRIHWHPGNVMSYEMRVAPAGTALNQGVIARFSHIATPRSARTTHYFMSGTRDYALEDVAVDEQTAQYQRRVIDEEDGPMLYAVDAQMAGAELADLRPAILPCDAGALRVRQTIKRLWEREQTPGRGSAVASRSDYDSGTGECESDTRQQAQDEKLVQ